MANTGHLSIILDAKDKIRNAIYDNTECVALLLNKQNINKADPEYDKSLSHILDHRYIDDVVQETGAWVLVEIEAEMTSSAMLDETVYVEIYCSQDYMDLKGWKGRRGNRRDNILCCVDKVLNGASQFGIGKLQLDSVRVTSSPNGFSSILATYVVPNFGHQRDVGNYD